MATRWCMCFDSLSVHIRTTSQNQCVNQSKRMSRSAASQRKSLQTVVTDQDKLELKCLTRASSNLRQTTDECVYFRSRDTDDGHTIRSAISISVMLHTNFTAVSAIEPPLLPIEVSHCCNLGIVPMFALCCSCDVDVDPMTFIYKLDPYLAADVPTN